MLSRQIAKHFSQNIKRAPLITADELKNLQKDPQLKILASSLKLPIIPNFNKFEEFNKQRIPNSQYFDYDEISDKTQNLPHMLPKIEEFATLISHLNLNKNQKIVCYDDFGVAAACRAYYTLTTFGFKNVYILDGGFDQWKQKYEVETTEYIRQPSFEVRSHDFELIRKQVRDFEDIMEASVLAKKNQHFEILDARSEARFNGTAPEPRKECRSGYFIQLGNIPGSKNTPHSVFLNSDQTFKSDEEIMKVLQDKHVDLKKHIISSCGSGMTASVIYVALELLGIKRKSIYDGSWTEYGTRDVTKSDQGKNNIKEILNQLQKVQIPNSLPINFKFEKGKSYSICQCGRSDKFPLCNGMHQGTIFVPEKYLSETEEQKEINFNQLKQKFEF